MAFSVNKRPQAERDIESCFVYIGSGNVDAAISFLVSVEASLENLSRFPYLGKQFETSVPNNQNMRVWHVRGYTHYLMFYEIKETTIDLIRLLHSSRDIDAVFG